MKNGKSLSYYQNLKYEIKIEYEKYENERWYIAYCEELGRGSCYGTGDNEQSALNNYLQIKDEFIEFLFNNKKPIPEPRYSPDDELILSGTFNVRTTPQLHGLLSRQAKKNGVSLNLFVNQILAMGSGLHEAEKYFDDKCNRIEDKIDAHHYQVTSKIIDYQKDTIEQPRRSRVGVVKGDFGQYVAG